MLPEIFTHIEGYKFLELLGQGGFGSVCKAIDNLGREVAIKVISLSEESGQQRAASSKAFLKEATTLARLNHPNIVTIYSFDIDSIGQPYLVMEFLPGEPLSQIIRSGRQLHIVEKISIVLQAARALQVAHQARPEAVVHRDIKPANLMVMPDLTVKLIDFGIAQVGGAVSRSMNIAGSLAYMSPEHWQPPLTAWGDIFSLGVVLYELLTGRVPYATEHDTVPAAYQKLISSTPPPPLKQYMSDVPEGLEAVVNKVLSKIKSNGYEDAQQFWLDLSRVHNGIRSRFLAEGLERATNARNARDYETATELLQRLQSIDRDNPEVGALQAEINQAFQRKERGVKVRQICERVEEALLSKKFDLAQMGLDEALQLDPESQTLSLLNQRVRLARELYAKIEVLVSEAEQQQQSGRWKAAEELVDEALVLDRTNTLALSLRAQIGRMMADEHRLCQEARAALDRHQFQEAFQMIRRAEALAPESEHVRALKEYAVTLRHEQMVREEIEAAFQTAQRLCEAEDYLAARRELQMALIRYPDQKRLLSLRDSVELKLAALQREKFVTEECAAAEKDCAAGNAESSLARLEDALRRYPDESRLQESANRVRAQIAAGSAAKKRAKYAEQTRQALGAGDASRAIVTLEMALTEFAGDRELRELQGQARQLAEKKAAENKRQSDEAKRIADAASAAAETRDRQAAADRKSEMQKPPAAPVSQEKRPVPEVRTSEPPHPAPAMPERELSATQMMSANVIREAPRAPVPAPAPLPETRRPPVPVALPETVETVETPQISDTPPSLETHDRKSMLVPVIAGVAALLILGLVGYFAGSFVFRPAPEAAVQFEITPAGTAVSVNGQTCISPCTLKLKPGKYDVGATYNGAGMHKAISVTSAPEKVEFSFASPPAVKEPAPQPALGTLMVTANVDHFKILVDGTVKSVATGREASLNVSPGSHRISLEKQNYTSEPKTVEVAANRQDTLQFKLNTIENSAPTVVEEPYIFVKSQAGAQISLDNRIAGQVPVDGTYPLKVTPGKHRVEVSFPPNYQPFEQVVMVQPGASLPIDARLKEVVRLLPSVHDFSATLTSIKAGQTTELKWNTENSEVSIDPDIGKVHSSGTHPVSPASTTTYTLTVKGEGPPTTRKVTITVEPVEVAVKPVILKFETGASSVARGKTMNLLVVVQNAQEVMVMPEPGPVNVRDGLVEIHPQKSGPYELIVRNKQETDKRSVNVVVDEPVVVQPPPPTENPDIKAVRDTIRIGFRDAFEANDVKVLEKVWLNIPKDAKEGFNNVFNNKKIRNVRITSRCDGPPVINGDSAQIVCDDIIVFKSDYDFPPQKDRCTYKLQKINGTWYITDRDTTGKDKKRH